MACESTGKNDRRVNQFNKIMLLNDIANQLIMFGVNNGNEKFMEYVDLNCGAIPEGDFDQVIDLSAPHQFLSLYMTIAEKRFAFAVTGLLKMNGNLKPAIIDFCNRSGLGLKLPAVKDAKEAFETYLAIVLDGMPCDDTKEVTEESETKVVWKKTVDTHEDAWKSAEGDLSLYYELLESFVNGLFAESGISLSVENQSIFSLSK